MKTLPLILVASLLANAGLVATVTLRRSSDAASGTASTWVGASSGARAVATSEAGHSLAAALNNDDPAALRDFLRAAGLPEDVVRSLVIMRIHKRYEPRYKALQSPAANTAKYWQTSRWNRPSLSDAQRKELTRLHREEHDEIERVLGAAPDSRRDVQLDFLPEAKRRQLTQIQQDYQELINEVQMNEQGFPTPADQEKLRYLRQEQEKDIAALLSPNELRDYEMHESQTANQLRWQLSGFDASEDEYRKIFSLQKAFDDQYDTSAGGIHDSAFWTERNKAQQQLNAQIKDALGDDRYAAYMRSQNYDYQQLQAAATRFNLPAGTADRVYSLRNDVTAGAQQINDNTSLSREQKKQALIALANATRDQVRSTLGDEVAAAFFANNGMSWLKPIGEGQVVRLSDGPGNGWSASLPSGSK